ncbi:ABC transporter ATP-binding protein [Mycobacterium sp. KBS0706]|uniref:dipeptide ABC transporter ATP-binding protein n=1 Tax=Mycobacterium sp. KBS0706 TaxID=2578109 RepID=UPI00110F8D2A|nr:ABC transporter ATP-binding protein [Mycobacterium sp. KBS0706]TSD85567.1 ABC transporter ATP-binding protein [Mycobacterium sp. KBS0706]
MTAPDALPPAALTIDALEIAYRVRGRDRAVLRDVSFAIAPGEAYGLVGESGCGKSTVALAAMRYLPANGHVRGGRILVAGQDIAGLAPRELRRLRAGPVSMVYQDPGHALNPGLSIGRQIAEAFETAGARPAEARDRAHDMLQRVQIADPGRVMDLYQHQLSGGMQQRVVIAMALAGDPSLLILDEPTTGLDATVEAEILELIGRLRREFGTALLFISHNLPLVGRICDRIGVLYAGALVEEGPTRALFDQPRHPYTAGLLRCLPQPGRHKARNRLDVIPGGLPAPGTGTRGCVFAERCALVQPRCRDEAPPLHRLVDGRSSRCHLHDRTPELFLAPPPAPAAHPAAAAGGPVLAVRNLSKTYGQAKALDDVSFDLRPGETLGLVGESGSGKSTLAHLLLGLAAPDPGGRIELDGAALPPRAVRRSRAQVKALQIVFQNPGASLNPSRSVGRVLGRALRRLAGLRAAGPRRDRLRELAQAVRLGPDHLAARPRRLSGGLKQRAAIARAFAGEPKVVVCDEPTSALDVSVQASILNLLADLQARRGVSYVFISHDLGVVRFLADRIGVLYRGRLVEIGPADRVWSGPHHPYSEALLSAAAHGAAASIPAGPAPAAGSPGCPFHSRCPHKLGPVCEQVEPPLRDAGPGHGIRCHLAVEQLERIARGETPAKSARRMAS